MTTADMPVPILEPIVEGRPVVVEMPVAVTGDEETRGDRIITAAGKGVTVVLGDVSDAWIWRAAPPPLGDVVAVRMAEWEPFEEWRHRCYDRTGPEGMVQVANAWKCVCEPCHPDDRKKFNRELLLIKTWRGAWVTYNHLVAIPVTLLLYVLAWLVQHPGRLFFSTSLVLVAIGVIFG